VARILAAVVALAAVGWLLTVILWTVLAHVRFQAFHRREGTSYPSLGPGGWVRFYVRTVVSAGSLIGWWVRSALGGSPGGAGGGGLPAAGGVVLCVHGFHLGASSLWGMRRFLERRGRRTAGVFLGLPYRSPDVYAKALERRMAQLLEASAGTRLDVVAHSMGGLVLRQALAESPRLAARLRRVVTLGTPHHGTGLLRRFRFGPVYRMMSRGAPYLEKLPAFADTAPGAEVTTLASRHDLVVYPVETAHLDRAERITLDGIGHLGLLTEREVQELVAARLAAPVPRVSARPTQESDLL
jgi:pimeloyl-ACP methyl ester carboxylesterase